LLPGLVREGASTGTTRNLPVEDQAGIQKSGHSEHPSGRRSLRVASSLDRRWGLTGRFVQSQGKKNGELLQAAEAAGRREQPIRRPQQKLQVLKKRLALKRLHYVDQAIARLVPFKISSAYSAPSGVSSCLKKRNTSFPAANISCAPAAIWLR